MRILITAAFGVLAGCGVAEEPEPVSSDTEPVEWTVTPEVSPPGGPEFRAAFSAACGTDQGEVGSTLCKARPLGEAGFSCDFASGDDDYRRYSADLTLQGDLWVLADPDTACAAVDPN